MILLVTPTTMEMELLLHYCNHTYSALKDKAPGHIEQYLFYSTSIYIGICGVGPVLSASTLTAWLVSYNITGIILCGIAGSYNIETLPINEVVFVTQDIYAEYGIRNAHAIHTTNFPFFHDITHGVKERIALPNPEQVTTLLNLHYTSYKYVTGITVAGVSANKETADILSHAHTTASVETMEGFSVALTCLRHQTPLLHLRSISNEVGVRINWDIEKSISELSKVLSELWSRTWI